MYAATLETLGQAGYTHYEISNWARAKGEPDWQTPGLASAHNLIYWRNQPYLGLGAGAYGTIQGQRWANVKRPQDYISRVEAGAGLGLARDERTFETIDRETSMAEHMLLGLRLVREGVGALEFEQRFGLPLQEQYPDAVQFGLKRGLSEWLETPQGLRLRLTQPGRFLANQVIRPFME
jgi:oxygen-independent coproporphyrinogen-3 oxidase